MPHHPTSTPALTPTPPRPPARLPAALAQPLGRIARRRRWLRVAAALLQTLLAALAVGLLAALILGTLTSVPVPVRWLVALAAWGAIIVTFLAGLRPVWQPTPPRQAASLVERKHPEHQERLLSAVEFSETPATEFSGSEQMIQQVLVQAQADAAQLNPRSILSSAGVWRWAWYCLPVVLAWLLLWALLPRTVGAGVQRALAPWNSAISPDTVNFHVSPGNVSIASGDPLTVRARVAAGGGGAIGGLNLQTRQDGGVNTQAMTQAGPHLFLWRFHDVEAGFQYRVSCRRGQSAWYQVRVIARPAITALTLHYHYPAYTHLPPRIVHGRSGWIRAVVGTQVQVNVQASETLAAKSHLHVDAATVRRGRPGSATRAAVVPGQAGFGQAGIASTGAPTPAHGAGEDLPLTAVAGTVYQATLNVWRSTDYHIRLVNSQGVENRPGPGRPIVALADPPPVIRIQSPRRIITVRPDDTVPVRFTASDTFGLTAITAQVRVGHSVPLSYRVATLPETTAFTGQWKLAVADQLLAANRPHARHVYYRLQARDNHQPREQVSRTARYELILNPHLFLGYQQRQDRRAYVALRRRLEKSLQQIQAARREVGTLRHAAPDQTLEPWQKRLAGQAQKQIARSAAALAAAPRSQVGAYHDLAEAAAKVAHGPLRQAAQNIAAATLTDQPRQSQQRTPDFTAAAANLAASAQQLQGLLNQLRRRADQREILDRVKHLAAVQRRISESMNLHPQSRAAHNQQAQIAQQLRNLIRQHQVLQTPAAAKVLGQFKALKNEVGKIVAAQGALQQAWRQQAKNQAIARRLNQLAQQQRQLNQRIADFAGEAQAALRAAEALAPSKPLRNAAVQHLQTQQFRPAEENQHEIARLLGQAAGQLARQAQTAGAAAQRARQTAGPQAPQQAWQLQQQAAQLRQAAAQARQLRQQQVELAAQTQRTVHGFAAHLPDKAQLVRQSSALPGAIAAAQRQTKQIENVARQGAPDLAKNLTQADQQMAQARQDQQRAARAEAGGNRAAAQEQQQAAQEHMSLALADLNGLLNSPEIRNVPRYQRMIAGEINPGAPPGQSAQGGGQPGNTKQAANGAKAAPGGQLMAAAQQLQQALAAENQAITGNSTAAHQAAAALRQAFGQLTQLAAQGGGLGPAGSAASGGNSAVGGMPGGVADNPSGITPGATANQTPPQAVTALGVSPDVWRRLGPLARTQLLDSARQGIPPGYRRQVREYYLRLAAMRAQ